MTKRRFSGNVRKAKATPFVFIPVSVAHRLAEEIEEKGDSLKPFIRAMRARSFLEKAPEDRKNRKVRHTNKYLDIETKEFIRREIQEAFEEKQQKDKGV